MPLSLRLGASPLPGTERPRADSVMPPVGQLVLHTRPLLTRALSFPGGDHRYVNNYGNSYTSEWSAPDAMKRYSMYLTPKGKRRVRVLPLGAGPGET